MEHYFELAVNYRGEERLLKGRLATFAYTYKFFIVVDGHELVFERDDEHNFRVVKEGGYREQEVDPQLLVTIVEALEQRAA